MAPLSHDLAGLILPHDHFGSHLNESGGTINIDLEKLNFRKAGQILAETWSQSMIDGFPHVAEYINLSINSQKFDYYEENDSIFQRTKVYLNFSAERKDQT